MVSVAEESVESTEEAASLGLSCAEAPADNAPLASTSSARYKRAFDLVVGIPLAILSIPLGILVGLIVRATSSGPILFRQERLGQNGRPFIMYKFRTMYADAETAPHRDYFVEYQNGSPAPGQEDPIFKLRHDPRVVPLGRFLRRLGLDELPQLFNVIRGDMSLVGPRPPLAYEVAQYSQRDAQRLAVRPGITGLWQVEGRDTVDYATMIALDLEYINRQALRHDLAILFRTVPSLLWSCIRD
jgi:lipopolysaccharide/colanic/teichoic acid biosynthesis glycosyltransferase